MQFRSWLTGAGRRCAMLFALVIAVAVVACAEPTGTATERPLRIPSSARAYYFPPDGDRTAPCYLGHDHFNVPTVLDLQMGHCEGASFDDAITTWTYSPMAFIGGPETEDRHPFWVTYELRYLDSVNIGWRLVSITDSFVMDTVRKRSGLSDTMSVLDSQPRFLVSPFELRLAPELAGIAFMGYVGSCQPQFANDLETCLANHIDLHDEPLFCVDHPENPARPASTVFGSGFDVCQIEAFPGAQYTRLPTAVIDSLTVASASGRAASDGSITVRGSRSHDPENRALTYRWQLDGPAGLLSGDSATYTFTGLPAGEYSIRLAVVDEDGGFDAVSQRVQVGPANRAPTAVISNVSVTHVTSGGGGSISASGAMSSDPDSDRLTSYTWSLFQVGRSDPIASASGAAVVFSDLIAGRYRLQLTVADAYSALGTATSDTIDVLGALNRAPTARIAISSIQQPIKRSGSFSVSGAGSSDPDGDALTYEWEVRNASGAVTGSATGVTATFPATAGTYSIHLVVRDTHNATGTADTTVTIDPPPPYLAILGPGEMQPYSSCTFTASVGNISESYTLTWYVSGGGAFLSTETGASYAHYAYPGSLTLRVTARRADGSVIVSTDRAISVATSASPC